MTRGWGGGCGDESWLSSFGSSLVNSRTGVEISGLLISLRSCELLSLDNGTWLWMITDKWVGHALASVCVCVCEGVSEGVAGQKRGSSLWQCFFCTRHNVPCAKYKPLEHSPLLYCAGQIGYDCMDILTENESDTGHDCSAFHCHETYLWWGLFFPSIFHMTFTILGSCSKQKQKTSLRLGTRTTLSDRSREKHKRHGHSQKELGTWR